MIDRNKSIALNSISNPSITNLYIKMARSPKLLATAIGLSLVLTAAPAMAHHAMDGNMPSTFLEGFLSGIAHPVIGFDHLSFVVAVGILAAMKRWGSFIPMAFVLAAMLGTGFHLIGWNIPSVELLVSGSILLFGSLIVRKDKPQTAGVTVLAAVAGLFHGYAYGESIFGAETAPLLAYLIGFTATQLVITTIAFSVSKALLQRSASSTSTQFNLSSVGLVICGIGLAFLSLPNH